MHVKDSLINVSKCPPPKKKKRNEGPETQNTKMVM